MNIKINVQKIKLTRKNRQLDQKIDKHITHADVLQGGKKRMKERAR
jgi:hypothetical protein